MARVVLWGLGSMGSGMARILLKKKGIEIVGAIAKRDTKNGKDLGEVLGLEEKLGVIVKNDAAAVLAEAGGDIVLHATNSFVHESFPELKRAMQEGYNVITIAEEMAYPQAQEPDYAEKLDRIAKENGVTLLGTGINPGFILDTLIIAMTGVCADVKRIRAARINDLSPFGPTVMKTQGVGTTVKEFNQGLEEGRIVGHIGFPESIRMIADSLGWELDEIVQTREPIISSVKRETPHVKVEPGMVAGCKHIAHGIKDGEKIITLEHPQQIHPELEGTETGDYIKIEGTPNVNLAITPEIPGGIGTMAVSINMIPRVITAEPGLVTMKDLPVPAAIMGDIKKLMK